MQMQGRAGLFLHLSGGEEMIKMRVGVDDADDFQAMRVETRHDQVWVATRVDDDGFFGDRVTDDRAVALQRANGEGFADEL